MGRFTFNYEMVTTTCVIMFVPMLYLFTQASFRRASSSARESKDVARRCGSMRGGMRLFGFKPADGEAAGDAMPFHWNGEWHVFYLKPPPGAWGYPDRAKNSMGHLVSKDLVDWTDLPTALKPGDPGELKTATGSGPARSSSITAPSISSTRGYNRDPEPRQTICQATSDDLVQLDQR